MELTESPKAKSVLEESIYQAVSNVIKEFKIKTGMSPHTIKIDMVNVTRMGELPDYTVGEVKVEFDT